MRFLIFLHKFQVFLILLNFGIFGAIHDVAAKDGTPSVAPKATVLQAEAMREAKILMQNKNYSRAAEILKKVNSPLHPEVLRLLSKAFAAQKDSLEEIRALEILISESPQDPTAFVELGDAYFRANRLDPAIENFRKALSLQRQSKRAYLGLLQVFGAKKSIYETRSVLTDMQKAFPEDPDVYSKMCEVNSQDDLFDVAIQNCRKAIELVPSAPENHVYLAVTYKKAENLKQAQKIIFQAARQFKKSELAQFTAGQFSDEIKSFERSLELYKNCLLSNSSSQRCQLGLARAHYHLRNYDSALEAYRTACAKDRTLLNEILKQGSLLRMAKENVWYEKYRAVAERCGI